MRALAVGELALEEALALIRDADRPLAAGTVARADIFGEVSDISVQVHADMVDVTDFGSPVRKFLPGPRRYSISLTCAALEIAQHVGEEAEFDRTFDGRWRVRGRVLVSSVEVPYFPPGAPARVTLEGCGPFNVTEVPPPEPPPEPLPAGRAITFTEVG